MTSIVRRIAIFLLGLLAGTSLSGISGPAAAEPLRVLWWNVSVEERQAGHPERAQLGEFLDSYRAGGFYNVTTIRSTRRGEFAEHMRNSDYDMIVVDATTRFSPFDESDLSAFRSFYSENGANLMLDGTFWIRNYRGEAMTRFPGNDGSLGKLLVNQFEPFRAAGGGVLIGTDHDAYQTGANAVLRALIPRAKFTGSTNPSRDGDFFGDLLLAGVEPVKPIDILKSWEAIPTQGEAPIGTFKDHTGKSVTLYSLVETSDKPGGQRKRPYISASFDPGSDRTAIDSQDVAEKVLDRMPTRKSPPLD